MGELTTQQKREQEIDKIRTLTGEKEMENKNTKFNWMRFNGQLGATDSGIFQIPNGVDVSGNTAYKILGETFTGIILKITNKLKTGLGKGDLETDEFNSYFDEVSLYEKQDYKNPIDSGNKTELQQKYPELKLINVAYVFIEGTIYKLTINGGSLSPFWKYLSGFSSKNSEGVKESCIMYNTVFGRIKEKNTQGLEYYQVTFKRGEFNKDFGLMADELIKINSRFNKEEDPDLLIEAGHPEVEPTNEELAKGGDQEIQAENIPF